MADTYNENEIVKLKHLNEFARQLNLKLDGETDQLLQRNMTYHYRLNDAVNNFPVPEGDIINITTSQLTKINGSYYRFGFRTAGSQNFATPILTATSSIGQVWRFTDANYQPETQSWIIKTTTEVNVADIQPQVITVNITFPAFGGYDVCSKTFTVNITE